MSRTQKTWILRSAVPAAGLVIALFSGRSIMGAVGAVALTGLLIPLTLVPPFSLIGIVFASLIDLYTPRLLRGGSPEFNPQDPDTQLFLWLGIPAALATVGLVSLSFKS